MEASEPPAAGPAAQSAPPLRSFLFAVMLLVSLGTVIQNAVSRRATVAREDAPVRAAQADSLARAAFVSFGPPRLSLGTPSAISPSIPRRNLDRAIQEYQQTLAKSPSPFLVRRIGMLLGASQGPEAAWKWFQAHPDERADLSALWRAAYSPEPLSNAGLEKALATTRQPGTSWYVELTRIQLLKKAGRTVDAARALTALQDRLRPGVLRFILFGVLALMAVFGGVALWILFGVVWASMPAIRSQILRPGQALPFAALTPRELGEGFIFWFFLYIMGATALRALLHAMGITRLGSAGASLGVQLALQVFAAAGGAALLAAHLRRHPDRQSPVPSPVANDVLWGGATYVAALPLLMLSILVVLGLTHLLPKTPTPPNPGATLALAVQGPVEWVLLVLVVAVAAPITEELFFRGVLYTLLRKRWRPVGAIALSATAFALVHPQLPFGFFAIFVLGAIFAGIVEMRRSLVPSIVAHALNNSIALVLISLLRAP